MTEPVQRPGPFRLSFIALAAALCPGGDARAADWRIAPRLEIGEILTDNARLTRTAPRADAVTRVTPGVDAALRGRRVVADFGYSLVHDAYARDRSLDATRQGMRGTARAELAPDLVSVDLGGFSSDGSPSPDGRLAATDRGLGDNAAGLRGVTVSPNLHTRLGRLADADLRYLVGRVEGFGGGTTRRLSGTAIHRASASLTQEQDFRRLRWRIDGDHAETATPESAAGGSRLRRSSIQVQPSYALVRGFDLVGAAGVDRIAARDLRDDIEAPRWSTGIRYAPSPRSSFAVAHGRRFGAPDLSIDMSAATPGGVGLDVLHRVAIESQALQAAQGLGVPRFAGAQDAAGAGPGLGISARDPYFAPDDRPYVERAFAATLRLPSARDTWSLGIRRTERNPDLSTARTRRADVAASASLGWRRALGESIHPDGQVSIASLRPERGNAAISPRPAASTTLGARLGIEHAAGPGLRLRLGAAHVRRHTHEQAAGSMASYRETVGYVTLRKAF